MSNDYPSTRNAELARLRSQLSSIDRDEDPERYERARRRYEAVENGWHLLL